MRGAAAGAAHTPHPAPWTTRATAVDTAAATAAPTSMLERPLPFSVLGSRAPASALGARMITGCLASTDGTRPTGRLPSRIATGGGGGGRNAHPGRRRRPQKGRSAVVRRARWCAAPAAPAPPRTHSPHTHPAARPRSDVPLGLGRARRSVDVYRNIRRHPYSPYTF